MKSNDRVRRDLRRAVQRLRARLLSVGISEGDGYAIVVRVALLRHMTALGLPWTIGIGLPEVFGPELDQAGLSLGLEALSAPELDGAWADDAIPGWVHSYWTAPDRDAADAKILDGGKISPSEVVAKTQVFTDRYMVEWLVQNSVGQTWLCICKKRGWMPDADQVLDGLDRRRADWRANRERGEVTLDALMPIHSEIEDRWKYWVPQPLVDDAVSKAPDTVHELTILDPCVGGGVFLLYAFDLLVEIYHEEARHRGEVWSDRQIAEWILDKNLHGVDIDPRCARLTTACLFIKAKKLALDARPRMQNIAAPPQGPFPDPDDPTLSEEERMLAAELSLMRAHGSLYKYDDDRGSR